MAASAHQFAKGISSVGRVGAFIRDLPHTVEIDRAGDTGAVTFAEEHVLHGREAVPLIGGDEDLGG